MINITLANNIKSAVGSLLIPLFSLAAHGELFQEVGDAGATLVSANQTSLSGRIDAIGGNLFSDTDADLFRIYVNDPGLFSATTVGGTTLDTSLFLLRWDGSPAYLNDDDASGLSLQSTLWAGNFARPLTAGWYYLGVATSGFEPENINGQLLFSPFALSSTETRGAADALSPATLWDFTSLQRSGEPGSYTINLTGVGAVPVPEPSTYGLIGASCLAIAVIVRRRRNQN